MEETVLCKVVWKCESNSQGYCDDEIMCGCEGCRNWVKTYEEIKEEEQ